MKKATTTHNATIATIINLLESFRLNNFSAVNIITEGRFSYVVVEIDNLESEFNSYRFKGMEKLKNFYNALETVGAEEYTDTIDEPFFGNVDLFCQLTEQYFDVDSEYFDLFKSINLSDYLCECDMFHTYKSFILGDWSNIVYVDVVLASDLASYEDTFIETIESYLDDKEQEFDEKKYLNEWYNAQQI